MRTLSIGELQAQQCYDDHIYLLPQSVMLLVAGRPVPGYLKDILQRWDFAEVSCDGGEIVPEKHTVSQYVLPKGEALIEEDLQAFPQLLQLRRLHAAQIESFLNRYQQNQLLLVEELLNLAQGLGDTVRNYPRLVIRLPHFLKRNSTANYVLNSALLSSTLAVQRKMPKHRAILVGCATILYAIATADQLSSATATGDSKKFRDTLAYFRNQQLPAEIIEQLQPQQNDSATRQMLLFSCRYCQYLEQMEASGNPHKIMVRILKGKEYSYDTLLLKEVLDLLSLYPPGSYLRLPNGLIGLSFAAMPDRPRYPTVQILQDPKNLFGKPSTLVLTQQSFPVLEALEYQHWAQIAPAHTSPEN